MNNEKLQLAAAMINHERLSEICDWLVATAPDYGNKPFNKRFETWLNKQAGERFGTEVYKNWGTNGEDKTYPKVTFYLHKSDYQYTDVAKFELSINYRGTTVQYDYETKTSELREHNENEKLYSITSVSDIAEQCAQIAAYRRESVVKMQSNLKQLDKLRAERDKLKAAIDAYNDKISYAISDSMRIK